MKPFRLLLPSFNKPGPKSPLFTQSLAAVAAAYLSSAANHRFSNSFFEDDEEGSGVYRHKLKFQRSTTIPRREIPVPVNSASFIGSVTHPLRVSNTARGGPFGVHTILTVRNFPQSESTFWSSRFLHKECSQWVLHTVSQVVKELNYVGQDGQGPILENHEEPRSDGGDAGLKKYRERLHLWQVFFSNPHDWWDNRKRKLNPRQPDFKHKHMDEALWFSPDDPPWIKTQIHRLDLRMAEQGHGEEVGHHRRISKWE